MKLIEQINRQKKLMGLTETPHMIKSKEFGELKYTNADVIVFEYRGDDLYIAPHATHSHGITSFYTQTLGQINLPKYLDDEIQGRLWTRESIVSFWVYPQNQEEMNKFVNDIHNEAEKIRINYPNAGIPPFTIKYVEIPWDLNLNKPEPNWDSYTDLHGSPNFKIVNIEDFGKYYKM